MDMFRGRGLGKSRLETVYEFGELYEDEGENWWREDDSGFRTYLKKQFGVEPKQDVVDEFRDEEDYDDFPTIMQMVGRPAKEHGSYTTGQRHKKYTIAVDHGPTFMDQDGEPIVFRGDEVRFYNDAKSSPAGIGQEYGTEMFVKGKFYIPTIEVQGKWNAAHNYFDRQYSQLFTRVFKKALKEVKKKKVPSPKKKTTGESSKRKRKATKKTTQDGTKRRKTTALRKNDPCYTLAPKGEKKPARLQKKGEGVQKFTRATWVKNDRCPKDPCDKDKRSKRQSKQQDGVDMYKCYKKGDPRPKYMGSKAGPVFQRKTWVLKRQFRKRKVATKTKSRKPKKAERSERQRAIDAAMQRIMQE